MKRQKTKNPKTKRPDRLAWVRNAAKLLALRHWEGQGTPASLDSAYLMKKLGANPPVYLMYIQGTADRNGFLAILEDYIIVTCDLDGTPIASLATNEQIEMANSWSDSFGQLSGLIWAVQGKSLEK